MKFYYIFPVLFFLLLTSCDVGSFSSREGASSPQKQLEDKVPGDGFEDKDQQSSARELITGFMFPEEKEIVPKVAVPADHVLIQVMDVNLDLDRYDEQILVVKSTDSPDSPIKIMVADYDTLRDRYIVTWEGVSRSTQRRFFSVTLGDIIGDHNIEILCSGIDSTGNQTIDMYRRSGGGGGRNGLSYEPILSMSVPGTIEVREIERSQAYMNGLKPGDSFPVFSTVEKEQETISSMYVWRSGENSYIKVQEEATPRKEIEDRKLRELFAGTLDAFEQFLSRNWSSGGSATLFFDKAGKEITLYSGDIQEVYHWTNSYRFLSNSISVSGENQLIPYMRIEVSIRVIDTNSIQISLYDVDSQTGRRSLNDAWSGLFFSSSDGRGRLSRRGGAAGEAPGLPRLSGFYRGESGEELFFEMPHYTLTDREGKVSGGFAVYNLNVPIISFKTIDERGIVVGESSYRLIYREKSDSDKITRNLILVPGTIGVRGFTVNEEPELRFQQVEYFQESEEQDQ